MLIWKGQEFRSKGVIVEFTPKISKARKKITQYTIPGRSGFLSVDEGTYESFALSVECHAKEDVNFDDICEWLDGYGTLSFDGVRQYTAIINNAIPFEKVNHFKKFIVQFLVNPIAEDITSTTKTITDTPSSFSINTYSEIEPILNITGSGNIGITINNQSFYLDGIDGTYILDCKNKIITKNNLNAANIMRGDFIKLKKGTNNISYTGTITSFSINYKKTYLWGGSE